LSKPEGKEGGLVSVCRDHVLNPDDGQLRADSEPGRRQARGKTSVVGKPLQRIADSGAVNRPRPDPADDLGEVQHGKCACEGVKDPSKPGQEAASKHDDSRPKTIDEIAFSRDQPSLKQHEKREGDLDRSQAPAELIVNRDRE